MSKKKETKDQKIARLEKELEALRNATRVIFNRAESHMRMGHTQKGPWMEPFCGLIAGRLRPLLK